MIYISVTVKMHEWGLIEREPAARGWVYEVSLHRPSQAPRVLTAQSLVLLARYINGHCLMNKHDRLDVSCMGKLARGDLHFKRHKNVEIMRWPLAAYGRSLEHYRRTQIPT